MVVSVKKPVMQRQTAGTAYFLSKQLLLYFFSVKKHSVEITMRIIYYAHARVYKKYSKWRLHE